jgi:3-isopropylmalate dehydrogenase
MNNLSNMFKVAVVGGEGIGPEVTAQSHRVLAWFAARRGAPITLREAQYGLIPYRATGKVLPPDTAEAMDQADAILWGATGGPETTEVPPAARKTGSLLGLRSKSISMPICGRSSPTPRCRSRRRSRRACSKASTSSSSAN